MRIVEEVIGYWHYHLSSDDKSALCGNTDVMNTLIPVSYWNKTPKDYHIPEKWCKKCDEIYLKLHAGEK
jgi:hypothetical protein